jgi:CRP/FNR family cyclic AMP-dependent transcriptional regulator
VPAICIQKAVNSNQISEAGSLILQFTRIGPAKSMKNGWHTEAFLMGRHVPGPMATKLDLFVIPSYLTSRVATRGENSLMAPTTTTKKRRIRDSRRVQAAMGTGARVVTFLRKQTIFTQGDAVGAIFYIQEGKVELTVVSRFGKEATLSVLGVGEFFGEGSLAEQPLRLESATAISDCRFLQIDMAAMIYALPRVRTLSDLFIMQLLARNIRYQEDLVDHLFDPREMRLARALLVLAHFGKEGVAQTVIPEVDHMILANMADISRLRVRSLVEKFRKSGFVTDSKSGLRVHSSLLKFFLRG